MIYIFRMQMRNVEIYTACERRTTISIMVFGVIFYRNDLSNGCKIEPTYLQFRFVFMVNERIFQVFCVG